MIYPVGTGDSVRLRGSASVDVVSLAVNRERSFLAVLTPTSLSLLATHPLASLVCLGRDEAAVAERGRNLRVLWKPDSAALCVTTTKNCLELYRVAANKAKPVYEEIESNDAALRRTSQDLFRKEPLPGVSVALALVVRLSAPASAVLALREELFVCLEDGFAHRLLWNGTVLEELSFHLTKLPFAQDQLQSKPEFLDTSGHRHHVFVRDAAYSPLIGGFALALSNGKAALLTCPSPKFHPSKVIGVWATGMSDARVAAVNHKYRLLSFGCGNGDVAAFHCDENTGALVLAYRVGAGGGGGSGPVCALSWSPYGSGLLVAWARSPRVALFSVFGAHLWSSEEEATPAPQSKALEWGPEGFAAFLGAAVGLRTLNFLRSVAVNNPVMDSLGKVVLMSGEEILVSPDRALEELAPAPSAAWKRLHLPCDYIANSWPLRYCAVSGDTVVVAGTRGLAHTSLSQLGLALPKWRLFGNETQEREMVVSGGLGIWDAGKVIVAACYDVERGKDDFRFYPLKQQLDNHYMSKWSVEAQILSISMKDDVLVTFDVESRVSLYSMSAAGDEPRISVGRLAEILISDVVFHPACVMSVHLTAIAHDPAAAAVFCPGADTLLVNAAGRLIMLSPQRLPKLSPNAAAAAANDEKARAQQLQQPLLIASYVEQVWHDPAAAAKGSQLAQSLWLQCGSRGMKVWLPLISSKGPASGLQVSSKDPPTFISKRIMLPFHLDVLPLVMRSEECLGLGVESTGGGGVRGWAVHRTSGLFLHHILKQLLKRNLGLYALEIAGGCRGLPYFAHVMELLLHNVLEEETTSSEPIPDPLLPRVIAFIGEFPEFLRTVAHCARKTEQTHWQHLFASAGNPPDLFEDCVRTGQLETAASFLIVLQNMEDPGASREHAVLLLQASLDGSKWDIAREIVRFLNAIDPDDIDSPPRTPMCGKTSGQGGLPRLSLASPNHDDAAAFVFQPLGGISRQRHSSISSPLSPKESEGKGSNGRKKAGVGKTSSLKGSQPKPTPTYDAGRRLSSAGSGSGGEADSDGAISAQLNRILHRFARQLLASGRLAELGTFAAYLDFHLVLWLGRERERAARVADFPSALARLHCDFAWPYPLLSHALVESLQKRMANLGKRSGPLQVITTTREVSQDSGIRTLELVPHNGSINADAGATKALLMRQQLDLNLPSSGPPDATVQLGPARGRASVTESSVTSESWAVGSSPSSPGELDWEGLEALCGEAAARGSASAEAQLRFLQQMAMEAACVEWSLLLCLLLRDFVGLGRALSVRSLALNGGPEGESLKRLRKGLLRLEDWAEHNCPGYKALVLAASRHLEAVAAASAHTAVPQRSSSQDFEEATHAPPDERRRPEPSAVVPNSQSWPLHLNTSDRIHVDVVSPITPTEQDQGSCALM